ncbi:TPA: hypothetical protein ACL7XI_005646, partial [Klebsiella pneumoniae]
RHTQIQQKKKRYADITLLILNWRPVEVRPVRSAAGVANRLTGRRSLPGFSRGRTDLQSRVSSSQIVPSQTLNGASGAPI